MTRQDFGTDIALNISADVAEIVIASPDGLNGYTTENMAQFEQAIRTASLSDAKLVAIRAEGKNFSIGASADLLVTLREMPRDERERFILEGQNIVRAIRESRKIVVAYINGFAAGGGFDLMLACDVVLVGPKAKLNLFYSRLALLPDHGALFFLDQRIAQGAGSRELAENRTHRGEKCIEAQLADAFVEECPVSDWAEIVEETKGLPLSSLAALKVVWRAEYSDQFERHLAGVATAQSEIVATPLVVERVDRVRSLQMARPLVPAEADS
ncbi:enoyl-CoA hydratase/isomerase family protein [uncultured Erythrobacter sp.]|uniref:enoyl-CoA hydratase/isomerase family protein n=1 Tax=uncultured Erythrobacter sp. TaxID=263913 RepID=UPI00261D4DEF|nr:enoyl-CoA hydratase/isomerase family protein [uncultured Erythrobacter sp.]